MREDYHRERSALRWGYLLCIRGPRRTLAAGASEVCLTPSFEHPSQHGPFTAVSGIAFVASNSSNL